MKDFFWTLPGNVIKVFSGRNILWHLLAIGLTAIIVLSGFDWAYFVFARNFDRLNDFLFPAIVIGAFLPILLPLLMMIVGRAYKSHKTAMTGWAIGQAAVLGSLVSSAYKALTGRIQPDLANTVTDISHRFNFGFLEHGIFWGWPSSHTTIAFAMAFALLTLHPKSKLIRYVGLAYALYVGIGVSVSIHWFSEFVAGAIIGTVIGLMVGKSFRKLI